MHHTRTLVDIHRQGMSYILCVPPCPVEREVLDTFQRGIVSNQPASKITEFCYLIAIMTERTQLWMRDVEVTLIVEILWFE